MVVQERGRWLTTPAFSWPLAELVPVQVAQGRQRNSLLGPWRQRAGYLQSDPVLGVGASSEICERHCLPEPQLALPTKWG